MSPVAIFGITNDGLNLAVQLLLLLLVAIWLALIYWTYADAKRRIEDPMLVGCATAAALFPFVGTMVYMIVRPPEYMEDTRERELEIAAAEARLAEIHHHECPHCGFDIERTFLRCPSCLRRLKEPCGTCGKPLDPRWKICPYCEAEVPRAAPQRRPSGRGKSRPRAGAADGGTGERRATRAATAAGRSNDEPTAARGRTADKPAAERRPAR